MTKKSTKKTTKKSSVPCGPSHDFNLERFKTMIIVALIALIIGITAAFTLGVQQSKNRIVELENYISEQSKEE